MTRISEVEISLSLNEKNTIYNWYQEFKKRSSRFGRDLFRFPEEELLLQKIERNTASSLCISESELSQILGWMDNALHPKPGHNTYFLPNEERLFAKLNQAEKDLKRLNQKADSNKEKSYQIPDFVVNFGSWLKYQFASDEMINEYRKKRERDKNRQLDQKIENISTKLSELNRKNTRKKNRPIEEKIAASTRLKHDLDMIRDKLKL